MHNQRTTVPKGKAAYITASLDCSQCVVGRACETEIAMSKHQDLLTTNVPHIISPANPHAGQN
jgi:hypothetical protein